MQFEWRFQLQLRTHLKHLTAPHHKACAPSQPHALPLIPTTSAYLHIFPCAQPTIAVATTSVAAVASRVAAQPAASSGSKQHSLSRSCSSKEQQLQQQLQTAAAAAANSSSCSSNNRLQQPRRVVNGSPGSTPDVLQIFSSSIHVRSRMNSSKTVDFFFYN